MFARYMTSEKTSNSVDSNNNAIFSWNENCSLCIPIFQKSYRV